MENSSVLAATARISISTGHNPSVLMVGVVAANLRPARGGNQLHVKVPKNLYKAVYGPAVAGPLPVQGLLSVKVYELLVNFPL